MKNILLFSVFVSILLFSCRREEIIASQGVSLRFSKDTVYLDTVFTTVGSSTYNLRVYNPSDEMVVIDRVNLEKQQGCFSININGTASNNLTDVEILPKDSIHIFIEVKHKSDCPLTDKGGYFTYDDKLVFTNKGTVQKVNLTTTVRDAYFHFPNKFIQIGGATIPYSIIHDPQGPQVMDITWPNDKPHVIYGYAVVDSGYVLRLNPGTEIYFHQNSGMWIYADASLKVAENALAGNGDSVIFAGDRLEPFYEDVPGQWGGPLGGIFLQGGSSSTMNNTVIKNATTGIQLDSAGAFDDQLIIEDSYILNSSRVGIYGGFGNIKAQNVVVANAGLYLFYAFGGNYQFRHCTFANYWTGGNRSGGGVTLSNYLDFQDEAGNTNTIVRDLQSAYFGNCIITGNNTEELSILKDDAGNLEYQFRNALIKVNPDPVERTYDLSDQSKFEDILINNDPDFINPDKNYYSLDTNSQAVDQGNTVDQIAIDILGNTRSDGDPDLGAFERLY